MPDEKIVPLISPEQQEAKSLLIPAIVISSVVGLVFGAVAMYVWMSYGVVIPPENESLLNNTQVIDTPQSEDTFENLKFYQNDELALSFQYPTEWGTLETNKEENWQIRVGSRENHFLLSASDPDAEILLGRGGTIYDYGRQLTNKNDFLSYCDDKPDCKIETNDHGVQFIREFDTVFVLQGNDIPTYQYFLFNPHSEFTSIVLSTYLMVNAGIDSQEAEEIMSAIVNSINFVE